MVSIADHTRSRLSGLGQRLRLFAAKMQLLGTNFMPKGLYARALIIIIAPMVLLQSVLLFVFLERHLEYVTRRLSAATVQDIAMLVSIYENYPHKDGYVQLTDMAREQLKLVAQIEPGAELPPRRPRPYFNFLDRTLAKQIRSSINKPYWIDTVGGSNHVDIRIQLDDAVLKVLTLRSRTYASNTHIFLVWMVATALILLAVAVLFLRNQIRPILNLADAAERFGRGQPVPPGFRIRGAREVRQASLAFIEMRDRIERHVEQRTTMLAGVSHDLRTVLTRFRLQLAMLGPSPEVDELAADVDEMQHMLEDYLAFAKGGTGEEATQTNVAELIREIHSEFNNNPEKTLTMHVPLVPVLATIRRNAFKRSIMNLVSNAMRFGQKVAMTLNMTKHNFVITVDDNGPGIPQQSHEDVFRPFYSLDDARNQNVKSTGLGLAIARDIVRAHGGEIHLAQSRMGGLKATIRIPI